MFKSLVVLSALAISTATAAHADTISGYFAANGTDTFTSNTVTFGSGYVVGSVGGTFASYLTPFNPPATQYSPVSFLAGALPYNNGVNMPPMAVYPSGYVPIFTATGSNGETFTFEMSEYDAGYVTDNTTAGSGCLLGSTCLSVTGQGYFLASGPLSGVSGPATFSFTSQYTAEQPMTAQTSFSASTSALPASTAVTPEPASLALLGTGLLGIFGVARRKFAL